MQGYISFFPEYSVILISSYYLIIFPEMFIRTEHFLQTLLEFNFFFFVVYLSKNKKL